jgi:hypothetical protein
MTVAPNAVSDETPPSQAQHDNRNLATLQILLVDKISVRRNEHLEPCGLGLSQQIAVFQFFPSTGAGRRDRVAIDQIAGKRSRRSVIQQN